MEHHRRDARLVPLVPLALVALAALGQACFSSTTAPSSGDRDSGADVTEAADTGALLDASSTADGTIDDAPEAGDAATSDAPVDSGTDAPLEAASADAAPDAAHVYESLGALRFDGVSDYVHLPAAAGGASETAFTVELWFRAQGATGNMFEVYNSGGAADRFLSLNAGQVCFYVFATPIGQPCTAASTYGSDGLWHHAAGTLGAGGVRLYVDGVLADSVATPTASTFTSDTDFRVGMGHTAYVSSLVYFQGDIDEVRVWSVERSAADIAASYLHTVDPTTAGLQGYWKLEETGASSVAHDATSAANDGQLMNFTFTPSPWISPGAF
jgi:hypothetical protein